VLQELKKIPAQERINQRIEKFGKMGFWEELTPSQPSPEGEEIANAQAQ
jgi:acetyl-CoA carboxylase carboxyl transferase subunit alpha